jgi:uncharacterized protein (TIGR02996 family)
MPALPAEVREVLEQAERNLGPAVVWLRGMPPLPLSECLRMLNESRVPSIALGWLIGMTMFGGDPRQQLAAALGRKSFRDDVIPHVLRAFASGVTRGQQASPRLWTSIEMLVGRVPADQAASLCEAVPLALVSSHAVVRGVGLRLAHELGAPARAAITGAREAASGVIARALDEALIALAGGEPMPSAGGETELLDQLLVEWRATHDPALEGAIAKVGADLARARGPITARSHSELEPAWQAIAAKRDPADVSRLLELRFPTHWKRALDRVIRLAEFSPDPRIAIRLADLARTFESRSSRPLHLAIAGILSDAPTPSASPGLAAVASIHASVYVRAVESIATIAIRSASKELVAIAPAEVRSGIEGLYAQLAANPGDLEARAVLADALQAAGDPRGELITLQLAIADGVASAGAARRVAQLLSHHGDVWAGPLPGIERSSRRFERGFLVACETGAENAAIARTLERPEWRTIEELTLRAADVELAPLVDRMPLLRRLCAHDLPLERLALARQDVPQLTCVFTRGTSFENFVFSNVRVLGGGWFSESWSGPLFTKLLRATSVHALVFTSFLRAHLASAIAHALDSGPPEVRFTLARYRSGFDPLGWRLRVRRGDPVIDVAWTYHRWADNIIPEVFEPLAAAGVTKVALHVPEMLRVHLDRLVAERPHGVEVVPGAPIDLLEGS